jgi:hypothetical protein
MVRGGRVQLSSGNAEAGETTRGRLSPSAQVLLWAYDRESLAFDFLCVVLVAVFLLVPGRVWRDPLVDGPSRGVAQLPSGESRVPEP